MKPMAPTLTRNIKQNPTPGHINIKPHNKGLFILVPIIWLLTTKKKKKGRYANKQEKSSQRGPRWWIR